MDGKEIASQFSKVGLEGLKEMGEWVKATKEFVVEQAPLICQEICNRGMIKHGTLIVAFLIPMIFGIYLWIKWKNEDINSSPAAAVGPILSIVSFIVVCVNSYYLLYIYFCPRLYVLEEVAKLVKTATG